MSDKTEIFQELADIATCASGDFHTLHFNVHGAEFDTLHAKILKKYYEVAANDADEFGEWTAVFGEKHAVKNPNEAAVRIGYKSLDGNLMTKTDVVSRCQDVIENICTNYLTVFKSLEKENCPLATGAANLLQSRLEYWAKEMRYFNARRAE